VGEVSVVVGDDGPVVYLTGEFDLANRSKLTQRLRSLQTTGPVVIDLSAVTFLDSSIIGALIGIHASGLNFTIRGAGGSTRRSLEILGVPDVLRVEE
jgi:anti-anti-sigma factor